MLSLITNARTFFSDKFGRCVSCMRQSFGAALAALAVYGIGFLISPEAAAQSFIGLVALGLTALWMLHVVVYAGRALTTARSEGAQSLRLDNPRSTLAHDKIGRRRTLGVLLRAASVGVVASVPALLLPSQALAFCGQCTKDDDCGGRANGWCCKNTAPVNSGTVCNECKKC